MLNNIKKDNVFMDRGRSVNLTTLQAGLLLPSDSVTALEQVKRQQKLPKIAASKKRSI